MSDSCYILYHFLNYCFFFVFHKQVNGKPYNYVNLLLGSMGSLHPANRLAAYATGRLQRRSDLPRKVDHAPITAVGKVGANLANQNLDAKPVIQNLKASGRLMPIVMSAKDSNDVQTHPLCMIILFLKKSVYDLFIPFSVGSQKNKKVGKSHLDFFFR